MVKVKKTGASNPTQVVWAHSPGSEPQCFWSSVTHITSLEHHQSMAARDKWATSAQISPVMSTCYKRARHRGTASGCCRQVEPGRTADPTFVDFWNSPQQLCHAHSLSSTGYFNSWEEPLEKWNPKGWAWICPGPSQKSGSKGKEQTFMKIINAFSPWPNNPLF